MSVIPSYTMLCEMPNSDFLKFFLKKQMKKLRNFKNTVIYAYLMGQATDKRRR